MSDRVTLTDYEARRLLNAIVKEFVQMTAEELEQQATEGNRYTDDKQFALLSFNAFPPCAETANERCDYNDRMGSWTVKLKSFGLN